MATIPKQSTTTFVPINERLNPQKPPRFALFEFGFRPFFLLSVLFAVIHLLLWVFIYLGKFPLPTGSLTLTPFLWHGHEMVFGYSYGIVIGFLLTAVTNWTGEKTLVRRPLFIMTLLWLTARIGFFIGGTGFMVAAIADVSLSIWVLYEFTRPVVIANNRRQWGFVGKLALLSLSNTLFYLGLFGILSHGMYQGVYLGFYLILAIVLVMGRRVIPFFTRRALGLSEDLKNPKWLDHASLVGFTAFCLWDTFFSTVWGLGILSLVLCLLYGLRLLNWYRAAVFRHPLIWVLWLSNAIICLGFLLKGFSGYLSFSPFLALHAFAVGGIGVMTVGMMARVSLGHTGRNVFSPPKLITPLFILMVLAVLARVAMPILLPELYTVWIMVSATLWVLASIIFLSLYGNILIRPRADGKPG